MILSRFWVKTCHFRSFLAWKVRFGSFLATFKHFRDIFAKPPCSSIIWSSMVCMWEGVRMNCSRSNERDDICAFFRVQLSSFAFKSVYVDHGHVCFFLFLWLRLMKTLILCAPQYVTHKYVKMTKLRLLQAQNDLKWHVLTQKRLKTRPWTQLAKSAIG